MSDVALVILAGGKGKRMQEGLKNDLPKVLQPLNGRPMLQHLLESVKGAPVQWPPVIVIGYGGEKVQEVLGSDYTYVWQKEQLGTGHAAAQARSALEGHARHVLILYGDNPFIPVSVVEDILKKHLDDENTMTLATATVTDFDDWRSALKSYGRVIRNPSGELMGIVEYKDCNEEQRAILEVNPSYFCVRADWLWDNLDRIDNKNAQGEYYLVDLVAMAIMQKERVGVISVDAKVALGANTVEDLKQLEEALENH